MSRVYNQDGGRVCLAILRAQCLDIQRSHHLLHHLQLAEQSSVTVCSGSDWRICVYFIRTHGRHVTFMNLVLFCRISLLKM